MADGDVRVRILRPKSAPVPCSYHSIEVLKREFGSGTLRDSTGKLVHGGDNRIPAGEYIYVCGFEKRLFDGLQRVSEYSEEGPSASPPLSRDVLRLALAEWQLHLDRHGAPEPMVNAMYEMARLIRAADQDWLNGLIGAIGERYNADALFPAILEYASAPQEPPGVELVLKRGWTRPYEDPFDFKVVDYVHDVLEGYVETWCNEAAYYAAWTAIIQSSGWGKSRTICQLSTKGVHVAYVSFLKHGSSGLPKRSPVADVLTDANDPRSVAAWVFAVLLELSNGASSPEDWLAMQMEEWVGIIDDKQEAKDKAKQEAKEKVEKHKTQVKQCYHQLREEVYKQVTLPNPGPGEQWDCPLLRNWVKKKTDVVFSNLLEKTNTKDVSLEKMKIVICLDEAASLFGEVQGSFLATRRFFSCIQRGSWIFGLVADTAGKLGLVFPDKMYDPSARATAPETKFFQPISVVGILQGRGKELLRLMSSHLKEAVDPTIPSEDVSLELFKWGRPLWKSALEETDLDATLTFAMQKLLGGIPSAQVSRENMTEAMGMAILGVSAGLEVAAWSNLAKDMVAMHMRTVSHIAEERDRVFSADALEPILGEAAAKILRSNLSAVLEVAERVFKQAFVIEGPRGEIVGRLIMVLAMHACCSGHPGAKFFNMYSHPVKIADFLTKLCGDLKIEVEGLVCFNRFIMLDREKITGEHLLLCFICCVAIIPQRNQKGFDAILPVLLPGKDGKYEPRAENMQGVPVQIRNRDTYTVGSGSLLPHICELARGSLVTHISELPPKVPTAEGGRPEVPTAEEGRTSDLPAKVPMAEGGRTSDLPPKIPHVHELAATASTERLLKDDTAPSEPRKRSSRDVDRVDYREFSDSDDPKKEDWDPDYLPSADEAEDVDDVRNPKRIRVDKEAELKMPFGIYMHLGGRNKSKTVELAEEGQVLIIHRLKYSFLKPDELNALRNLRSAFFKLADHIQGKGGEIVKHSLTNYFKPEEPMEDPFGRFLKEKDA